MTNKPFLKKKIVVEKSRGCVRSSPQKMLGIEPSKHVMAVHMVAAVERMTKDEVEHKLYRYPKSYIAKRVQHYSQQRKEYLTLLYDGRGVVPIDEQVWRKRHVR